MRLNCEDFVIKLLRDRNDRNNFSAKIMKILLYTCFGMVSIDAGPIDAGIIDADSLMPKLLRPVTIDAGHY